MAYLEKDDYTVHIALIHLDEILEQAAEMSGLAPDAVLTNSEEFAKAEVRSYLASTYDMDAEFSKLAPALDRERLVMLCVIDISIYHIHHTINPRDIPEIREKNYLKCIDDLKAFRDGLLLLSPNIPRLDESSPDLAPRITICSSRKFISKPFSDPLIFEDEDENN